MASNKRLLKKEIRMICGTLAGECVVAKITVPGINTETINQIIYELAALQENALSRTNFDFPQSPKAFADGHAYRKARNEYFAAAYRKLKEEFNAHIEAIVKKMNAALPAEQKEANKAAAKS